ncbi:MAG: molecular chaperone DnaJ [bacterium]
MTKRDYYEVLGVAKTASADEIKRAYRKLARQYHPDVNKEAGSADKFKEINEAYQVLSDPNKRSQFDYYGQSAGQTGQGFGGFDFGGGFQGFEGYGEFGDLFDVFFGQQRGGRRQTKQRGADLRYDLRITLQDAAAGLEKELEITNFAVCDNCKGSGAKPGTKSSKCSTCQGSGQVKRTQRTMLGNFTQVTACPTCGGNGEKIESPCSTCQGEGRVKKRRTVKVQIPAGIDSGYRLRVTGAGDAGAKGAGSGDLYVFISVEPHPLFERDGTNLYHRIKISYLQAILGDEIEVPTLTSTATLKIPPGTQPNTNFRIKGQGVASIEYRGKGDLYVLIEVEIPKKISRTEEEALRKLKK